jgi:hypothetical protein
MRSHLLTALAMFVPLMWSCVSQASGETRKIVTTLTIEPKPAYVAKIEVENLGRE